ncbi:MULTISPECIES: L-serine ammonia-lyase [unclassified Acinetobacter]|uniref:L-serine ammonia-lyase n=1 Tax=unclassified Acinetobacter TaxID=196816 RepID=UPI0002CEB8A8|nr:L-serine ammonia-lyase [Acinetobacter sp. CIP-A165]ENU29927.1 L-serine ammonia-lyase [Acinetobacter sp. CIP-A165]MDR7016293.1 L-serine dehydratase [Prolinoborus sp. 3657]
MTLSVFDLFKIGVGPSSSHTVAPMRAAYRFTQSLKAQNILSKVAKVQIFLYGSLSSTGIGHGTDKATLLGLMGNDPETIDIPHSQVLLDQVFKSNTLKIDAIHTIDFDPRQDIIFIDEALPYHPNAMRIKTEDAEGNTLYANTYYSIGGGFIIDESHIHQGSFMEDDTVVPYPFQSAKELLALCKTHQCSISHLMLENEKSWRSEAEIRAKIMQIWHVMQVCIQNGLQHEGILAGGLNVKRRAKNIHQRLLKKENENLIATTFNAMEWVNLYALAVNEENAAGGRVVTAPTNGAAGIIPAVLSYYVNFSKDESEDTIVRFFLSAAAVGILCKLNASISGAEVGCQGEVGSACAMASAGLAEILAGTPEQVEHAAEIGLEHNLGLTCDPVGGLVQVPCIERNAIAAVKAINAAQMALHGDGEHYISLDKVIQTMKETGKDMSDKYKETSKGGLAVNSIEC